MSETVIWVLGQRVSLIRDDFSLPIVLYILRPTLKTWYWNVKRSRLTFYQLENSMVNC